MTLRVAGLVAVLWPALGAAEEAPAAEHAADPAPAASTESAGAHEEAAGGDHAEGAHHGPHAHHVALFAGATRTEHETAPSVGADYLFYLPVLDRRIGVGPLVDATFGEHLELVAGVAVAARAPIGLQLALGPIAVFVAGEHEFGGRLNLSFAFHLGEMFSVGPSVSADFLPHAMAYVFGVNGGIGF
jgi:hypothetical protein